MITFFSNMNKEIRGFYNFSSGLRSYNACIVSLMKGVKTRNYAREFV